MSIFLPRERETVLSAINNFRSAVDGASLTVVGGRCSHQLCRYLLASCPRNFPSYLFCNSVRKPLCQVSAPPPPWALNQVCSLQRLVQYWTWFQVAITLTLHLLLPSSLFNLDESLSNRGTSVGRVCFKVALIH